MRSPRVDAVARRTTVPRVVLVSLLLAPLAAAAAAPPRVMATAEAPNAEASVNAAPPVAAFVALSVPDLEASAIWYERTFGLARVMTVPRTGAIAGVVALEGPGLMVELIQIDSARAATERPELTHGIAKAGYIVEDFDSTIAELKGRGVTFFSGPYAARPGVRANAMFRDNAGNVWQIMGKKG